MMESVLGVIGEAQIKTGMLKSQTWVLVVTDRRLLGARITDDLMKRVALAARAQARASGSGFLGQWGAQVKSGFAMASRYLTMPPEAILAETPGNWALWPGQVSSIRVEHVSEGGDDTASVDYLRITIGTSSGKGVYSTKSDNPSRQQVQALLWRIFGPIVK